MRHIYHFCKVVGTTNVLAVAVYFSSKLPIMTIAYHQASCDKESTKTQKTYMNKMKITPLIRFLLVLCIVVAGTAVKPQVVKADAKPGWIVDSGRL